MIKDQRGVTALEFGLIAMPMFVLIMGSLELGMNMFMKAHADGVLRQASRMAITGDRETNGPNGERIDEFVREQIGEIYKGTKVDIDKQFYDRFDQVRQPESRTSSRTEPPYCWQDVNGNQRWDVDPGRTGLGGADDIIKYRADISYPALFPLVTNTVTQKDRVSVTAETTLRNEPFEGSEDHQPQNCCISAASGNPVDCT